jgi:hypothetical protein
MSHQNTIDALVRDATAPRAEDYTGSLAEEIRACAEHLRSVRDRRHFDGATPTAAQFLDALDDSLCNLSLRAMCEAAHASPGLRAQARMLAEREAARQRAWPHRVLRWMLRVLP